MPTQYVTTNDSVRIACDATGQGPALLLLHGAGKTRQGWHKAGYVDRLKKDFRVISVATAARRSTTPTTILAISPTGSRSRRTRDLLRRALSRVPVDLVGAGDYQPAERKYGLSQLAILRIGCWLRPPLQAKQPCDGQKEDLYNLNLTIC